ncbi:MAG: TetR/AcrR family transcriptional regulator [Ktedonobacteraceae bacterium]|nr:TetR/AcrR family transcriptional regulator [Ktedonobacteraceae bacterium]MBO0793519.1 TetR/AcrR family transcriptional regulator [Ktedonobacteraceae bacterium]
MNHKNPPSTNPARSLALLWGSRSEAGRSGLTLKDIVMAAMQIADSEGVDALSMRNVAGRLGMGTMSLYTHVPGKADLIDLMFDTAYGELYENVESPSQQPGGWRGALLFIAKRNWDLYHRHPWMLQIATGRSILGPHAATKYEAELRPLDNLGLSDVEMDAVLTLILTYVEGTARAQIIRDRTQQDSGMTDEEWWVAHAPILDKLVDPTRFPVATRVGISAGQEYQGATSPEFAFHFGLERILDGVAALIASKKEQQ